MPPTESLMTGYQGTGRLPAPRGFTARRGGRSSKSRVSRPPKTKPTPPPSHPSDSDSDTECDMHPTQFGIKIQQKVPPVTERSIYRGTSKALEQQQQQVSTERRTNVTFSVADKDTEQQEKQKQILVERQTNTIIYQEDKDIERHPKEVLARKSSATNNQHKQTLAERQTNFTVSAPEKDTGLQKQGLAEQRVSTAVSPAGKDIERQQKQKPAPIQITIPPQDESAQQLQTQLVSAQAMDSERKIMARSIIAGFPRRALETLLLDAALGNTNVMKEVIEWNSKHPVQEEETPRRLSKSPLLSNNLTDDNDTILVEPHAIVIDDDEDFSYTFQAYNGLRPTATQIKAPGGPKARRFEVRPTKPVIPVTPMTPNPIVLATKDSNTAQKIASSLQAAKRRRERGEEYVAPVVPDRLKRRKTGDRDDLSSPDPPINPEPRVRLTQPLSELTKDMDHTPLIDIEAYVNRPAAERQLEAENNKVPGKVKRPMNSFMLYRKAYQLRAKEYGLMTNHQVVSQLCGDSWPLEPEEIREQFAEWARVERDRHEEAHPGYKFTPARPGESASILDELMD